MRKFVIRCVWLSMTLAFICLGTCTVLRAATDEPISLQHESCKVVRMQPTGMLLSCGMRVLSLELTMDNLSRTVRFTSDGLFHFGCPIEQMCNDQPRIAGWMILKEAWQMSRQDEDAIYQMLLLPPAVKGPQPRLEESLPKSAKSLCGTFKIDVAGMDGRAACYDGDNNATVIAVIASGEELGFAFLFSQNDTNWESLRDRVIKLAASFNIERAEGDIQLMKWIP